MVMVPEDVGSGYLPLMGKGISGQSGMEGG